MRKNKEGGVSLLPLLMCWQGTTILNLLNKLSGPLQCNTIQTLLFKRYLLSENYCDTGNRYLFLHSSRVTIYGKFSPISSKVLNLIFLMVSSKIKEPIDLP